MVQRFVVGVVGYFYILIYIGNYCFFVYSFFYIVSDKLYKVPYYPYYTYYKKNLNN